MVKAHDMTKNLMDSFWTGRTEIFNWRQIIYAEGSEEVGN